MAADKTNKFYPLIRRDKVSHLSRGPWVPLRQHLLLCVQLRDVWRRVERRDCPAISVAVLVPVLGVVQLPTLVENKELS